LFATVAEDTILSRLLALNQERAGIENAAISDKPSTSST
jgi:hypothetical protein